MFTFNIQNFNVSLLTAAQESPLVLAAGELVSSASAGATDARSRFTKLDSKGDDLPADATGWSNVRDNSTGLIWSARNITDERKSWADAEKAALAYGEGFRLPTVDELQTLIDRTQYDPAMHGKEFFTAPQSAYYWTSSSGASDPDCAWIVYFLGGGVLLIHRDNTAFVRAVRGPVAASQ